MTCIVGLVDKGRVFIGGDSAGVSDRYGLVVRTDRKVFRNGDFIFGFTDSFRMGQLLAYALTPPKPREGADAMAFMVTDFVNAVRDCLKTGGYAKKTNEEESAGAFLVGYRGRLFEVHCDYQVGESTHGFSAVGCASWIALGSLRTSRDWQDPTARLTEALETAQTFSAGVRAPFVFESTAAP